MALQGSPDDSPAPPVAYLAYTESATDIIQREYDTVVNFGFRPRTLEELVWTSYVITKLICLGSRMDTGSTDIEEQPQGVQQGSDLSFIGNNNEYAIDSSPPGVEYPDALARAFKDVDAIRKPSSTGSLMNGTLLPESPQEDKTFRSDLTNGEAHDEQREFEGRLRAGCSRSRLATPYARAHSELAQHPKQASAQPPSVSWSEGALVYAGSQSEVNPISESRWNNDGIKYPIDAAPSPSPCPTSGRNEDIASLDPRRIKKQTADRNRNKARDRAKRRFKVLFPMGQTSNDTLRIAIKVIKYLKVKPDVPPNMHTVNEWDIAQSQGLPFSITPTLDAASHPSSTSNPIDWSSSRQDGRKSQKKEKDRARNAVEQTLIKEIVAMFRMSGGDTVVKALGLASDYLVYAKAMNMGMVPIASKEWHDAYETYAGAGSRFFASE
ncbi:hypothetical protein ONZ45_g19166 [Pleurotus djamor]|nr:hypothetical protein ONZ45_g19166 [Pleurotus djamor]